MLQTSMEALPGGSNILAARLPTSMRTDGRVTGYPTTFHPSATASTTATPIALRSGDAHTNINIELRPVELARVTGSVIGPNGPEANFAVHLIPAFAAGHDLERSHETAVAVTDARGVFTFAAVPRGQFVLKAWRLPQVLVIGRDVMPPDASLWAEMPIAVAEAGLLDLQVKLRPGATVSGRAVFDGAIAPPSPPTIVQTTLSVAFQPASWPLAFGARLATRVSTEFDFVTQGLPPGRTWVNLPNQFTNSLRGWHFESAIHEGKDLTLTPLVLDGTAVKDIVITFSDRRSELSGTVTDPAGRPDANAAVVVFPVDYRAWIQGGLSPLVARAEVVSQTGTYTFAIRPGDYLIAVVSEDALPTWPDASAIEAVARNAARVTILRGESKRHDLKRGGR
jgi:hypothetical protein